MIERFITSDGELYIPGKEWLLLNKNYTHEEIIDDIVKNIENNNIVFPMRKITKDDALNDFIALYTMFPLKLQKGKTCTKCDYKYDMSDEYFGQNNTGNMSSDYFQQYNRMCCSSTTAISPVDVWNDSKQMRGVLKGLWTFKGTEKDGVSSSKLLSKISLRRYIAAQFKPCIAKSIYTLLNSKRVIDFSMGWGDRLAGFYATKDTEYYCGTDPNSKLHPKYAEQVELYKKISTGKESSINCSPAEDFDWPTNSFDTVFTSPPYFNKEHYSTEENQSYKRYTGFDAWMNGFMYIVLEKTWNALIPGGKMAINISDIYDKTKRMPICDNMNDFIQNKLKGKYLGCIGMSLAKRPNMHSIDGKEGVYIEPVWMWEKK